MAFAPSAGSRFAGSLGTRNVDGVAVGSKLDFSASLGVLVAFSAKRRPTTKASKLAT